MLDSRNLKPPTPRSLDPSRTERGAERGPRADRLGDFVSRAVLEAAGSGATNKYAEGYPGSGTTAVCEFVDVVEQLAIDRASALRCEHVNVQPHSGTQANMAVYFGFLRPGDKLMGMDLSSGGPSPRPSPLYSGRDFEVVAYASTAMSERSTTTPPRRRRSSSGRS